jgi:hypothetical protein
MTKEIRNDFIMARNNKRKIKMELCSLQINYR